MERSNYSHMISEKMFIICEYVNSPSKPYTEDGYVDGYRIHNIHSVHYINH